MKLALRTFALGWSLALGVAHADESLSARQWLERMAQAAHQLNFDGTLVYSHGGNLQTMRVVHGKGEDGERERILSLSGPSREVLRDNDKVTCILPDKNEIVVEHTGPARIVPLNMPSRFESLEQHYELRLAGPGRVAGFGAQKITITPRDRYRYGHVFWLHNDNGLLLRSEMIGENNVAVEELMFTALQFYEALPARLLEAETTGTDMIWQRQGHAQVQAAEDKGGRWVVRDLPPGFVLDNRRTHLMPGNQAQVEHMVFTDGLASVSVFVGQGQGGDADFLGNSRMGAVHAYARMVNGHHVTVVGEVPAITVRMMADSVMPRGEQP